MSVLKEATAALRRGEAVEVIRDKQRRLRVYKPQPAHFYELPKGISFDERVVPLALPHWRIVAGEHETYAVEHVGHRPGGDLDVVVSATPHDHRAMAYIAFRRDQGVWRPLAGRDQDLEAAVSRAQREQRYAGWDSPELATLLAAVDGGA
ncbi:hypothetical protein [Nonomuraea sp. NPDC023979]|uniref:hypothetical protein n=1 Tax=Nonomuraea sp. NPDC023979 TaxID=3154796 RepID=UPI0033C7D696